MMRILSFALAWLVQPASTRRRPAAPPSPRPQHLTEPPSQSWIGITPTPYGPLLIQQAPPPPYRDYQMNRILTPEEKKALAANGHADDGQHDADGRTRGDEPFRRQDTRPSRASASMKWWNR